MSAPTDPTRERSQREDDVLERIAKIVTPERTPAGETHVGDDAAVLLPFVGQAIISTDVAVLGVHLDATLFPLEDLGYKAVMAALSDLAAMGARPRGLVVAVSAPPGTDLEALHRGVARRRGCVGDARARNSPMNWSSRTVVPGRGCVRARPLAARTCTR